MNIEFSNVITMECIDEGWQMNIDAYPCLDRTETVSVAVPKIDGICKVWITVRSRSTVGEVWVTIPHDSKFRRIVVSNCTAGPLAIKIDDDHRIHKTIKLGTGAGSAIVYNFDPDWANEI